MKAKRVDAVIDWLRPIAEPVAKEAEFSRWISAHNADTDQAEDWCTACARAEVTRLNALHPDHEYLVDGGWGSSTDCPPYCCKCGKTLSDHLTSYAIRDEIDHYSRHSVTLRCKQGAERAFRFVQMLESHDFDVNDAATWRFFRRLEMMCKRAKGGAP
ncbi:hypothetical protein [Roseateles sp.]|uniref:hypothetical protein n=1 Tax=Roseateles sp. TaxID=1971397 RepID=UPI002E04A350|nr:hypothetical protein [Roseateles sp.]